MTCGRQCWLALALSLATACSARPDRPDEARAVTEAAPAAPNGMLGGLLALADRQDSLDRANPYASLDDPCILVSGAEVERFIGPLLSPPYRAGADGDPEPQGAACHYRGRGGQVIAITPQYTGGQAAFRITGAGMAQATLVVGNETGKADTLDGDWDQVRWFLGTLDAVKGDVLIGVDVSDSRAGPEAAGAIAALAIDRLPAPLDYDGAAATRGAPPAARNGDACAVVPPESVTAILGSSGEQPSSSGNSCLYRIARGGASRSVLLKVDRERGFARYNQESGTWRVYQREMQDPTRAAIRRGEEEMKQDPEGRKMLAQMQGAMRAGGMVTEDSSAWGKTDSTSFKGPWDAAMLVGGFRFMAVKRGTFLEAETGGIGLDVARRLVAAAAQGPGAP